MKKYLLVSIIMCFVFFVVCVSTAHAFSLMDGINKSCTGSGTCSVCDILRVLYNVGRFIFMSMSGVALIMILWFAIGLLMNFGSAQKVEAAKSGILNTVLALLIILAAWTLVNGIGWGFLQARQNSFWTSEKTAGGETVWKWWVGPECN